MANLSSGESSKPHSPQKAYLIGELKDAKLAIAQKDEVIRQMEARLQRLEMDREDTPQYRERRHHHHHRHTSRSSQSSYGHHEEPEWRRHHNFEDRRQNVAKPYLPYVKLPTFNGDGDPNVYLGWEAKCEQIFNVHEVQDDQKACMRARFVPPPYRKEHLLRFQRLHQGHRTVDEYFQDFKTTLVRINMHDNEETKIAKFVGGLRREIKDFVELHEYSSLKKVVHLAIKVESHLLKTTTFKHTHDDGFYNSSWKDTHKPFTKTSPSNFSNQPTSKPKVSTQNPSTPKSPTKTSKTKCFKCLSFGHIAVTCPNKQTIMLQVVNQHHLTINNKRENEREKEGQDNLGLIPLPPRDAISNPPKLSHLLRGFFTKYFIPKSSFQMFLPVDSLRRLTPTHIIRKLGPLTKQAQNRYLDSKSMAELTSALLENRVEAGPRPRTEFLSGTPNMPTKFVDNSFVPGEHDTNPKMTKDIISKIQKGQSSQNSKLRLTKHQDNISRRRIHEPEHLKFFLLVFLNKGIWEAIENGPFIPQVKKDDVFVDKPRSEWTEKDSKKAKFDWIAKNIITSSLSCDEFFRISQCEIAKEMWDILEVTHEGTNDVKRARKHALIQEYEMFRMQKGETISEVHKRFSHIVNHLMGFGKTFEEEELNIKILKCLDRTWQPKVTAMSESKDLTSMSTTCLFGKLRKHELEMNRLFVQENNDKQNKGITLKTVGYRRCQDSSDSEEDTFSLLSKKFSKLLRKNSNKHQSSKRYNSKKPSDFNTNKYTCFGCGEKGHIKAECPKSEAKETIDFKKRERRGKTNKAYIAWGDNEVSSSNSPSEDAEANLCLKSFISSSVSSSSSSKGDRYYQLLEAFKETHEEANKLVLLNNRLKENQSIKISKQPIVLLLQLFKEGPIWFCIFSKYHTAKGEQQGSPNNEPVVLVFRHLEKSGSFRVGRLPSRVGAKYEQQGLTNLFPWCLDTSRGSDSFRVGRLPLESGCQEQSSKVRLVKSSFSLSKAEASYTPWC
uniref:Phytoalexin-deficient 4-2 protein n=1 Tax=Phaseolus vulgaris TaxID=3885 RepID=I7A4H7_PHAVU|nr:phytoalexin-deficient 4-2 protein [Phaseolus vulgaris]